MAAHAKDAALAMCKDAELAAMLVAAGVPAARHAELADACSDVLSHLRTPRPKAAATAGRRLAKALGAVHAELEQFEQATGVELRVDDEIVRAYGWRLASRPPVQARIDARPTMPLSLFLQGCIDWLRTDYCERPTWNALARAPSDPNGRPPNDTYDVLRFLYQLLLRFGMGVHAHRRNAITARIAGHVMGRAYKANEVAKANAAPGIDGNPVRRRNSKE